MKATERYPINIGTEIMDHNSSSQFKTILEATIQEKIYGKVKIVRFQGQHPILGVIHKKILYFTVFAYDINHNQVFINGVNLHIFCNCVM